MQSEELRSAAGQQAGPGGSYFLPNFCAERATFVLVIIAELVAVILVLVRGRVGVSFWLDLGLFSLFLQWIALSGAAVLCFTRRWFAGLNTRQVAATAFMLLVGLTVLLSELSWQAARYLEYQRLLINDTHWVFLARSAGIAAIVVGLALRYFYIQWLWRLNVQREAHSRIQALQARIRPHFLFNSINTIINLVHEQPAAAERALEDLAELFRTAIKDSKTVVTLREELDVAEMYIRLEQLRLGDRLVVNWHTDTLPDKLQVPRLILQPLLENAVYHGIEQLPDGGEIEVTGREDGDEIIIEVSNPLPATGLERKDGHKMALDNIRQRLQLAFSGAARLEIDERQSVFHTRLCFPSDKPVITVIRHG
ncbi:MAG: histidine kinase [Gammaproteobacteria bacterium]|nr:histidine kinase [Gammaproteobacteria bacterium]